MKLILFIALTAFSLTVNAQSKKNYDSSLLTSANASQYSSLSSSNIATLSGYRKPNMIRVYNDKKEIVAYTDSTYKLIIKDSLSTIKTLLNCVSPGTYKLIKY